MQKNRHRITKTIGALVLALVLAGSFGALGPKQTMAAGGMATVTLANVEGLSADTKIKFEMYKVGHFSGPGLELDDKFKDSGASVDFPADSEESDEVKAEKMLDSARTLAAYIDDNQIDLGEAVAEFNLKPGESDSAPISENALYLVKGHTTPDVADPNYVWEPQPVYVAILNGDSSITISNIDDVVIKIIGMPVGLSHMVYKQWGQLPEGVSLSKIEAIFVNIRYGGKIVDTVKLAEDNDGDNDWSYSWESQEAGETFKYIGTDDEGGSKVIEFKPEGDPKWTCDEVLDVQDYIDNFETLAYEGVTPRKFSEEDIEAIEKAALRYKKPVDNNTNEQHVIINTYDKKKLELTKKLDGYVDAGDRSNVTVAFRVIAKDKHGNEVYNNVIGMAFSKDGEIDSDGRYTQTKVISDIPVNADEITVTEVYSGQYAGDETKSNKSEDPKNKIELKDGVWTVTMDNTHDYHQGSGVVNKYGDGDLKGQDGLINH